jgi:hypothetical protein
MKKRSVKKRSAMKKSPASRIKKSSAHRAYREGRPSPSESATMFSRGSVKKGGDGNLWKIIIASNGVRRWTKV